MKAVATILMTSCIALASAGAYAMDDMKKGDMKMSMQDCKDHMAMQKEGMKKTDDMMKKDALCSDMMKKSDAMKKDGMMKKDEMPMKKDASGTTPMTK